MNRLSFFYIVESGQVERFVELRGTTTVGRDSANDIILDELTISRCHALLLVRPEGSVLIDLDSTNGTWVNGIPAPPDEAVPLTDGDTITLGRLVAHYYAPTPMIAPAKTVGN
jgi:pSer/pThr/pTyr-binding forkhead associated (FHA) protein